MRQHYNVTIVYNVSCHECVCDFIFNLVLISMSWYTHITFFYNVVYFSLVIQHVFLAETSWFVYPICMTVPSFVLLTWHLNIWMAHNLLLKGDVWLWTLNQYSTLAVVNPIKNTLSSQCMDPLVTWCQRASFLLRCINILSLQKT